MKHHRGSGTRRHNLFAATYLTEHTQTNTPQQLLFGVPFRTPAPCSGSKSAGGRTPQVPGPRLRRVLLPLPAHPSIEHAFGVPCPYFLFKVFFFFLRVHIASQVFFFVLQAILLQHGLFFSPTHQKKVSGFQFHSRLQLHYVLLGDGLYILLRTCAHPCTPYLACAHPCTPHLGGTARGRVQGFLKVWVSFDARFSFPSSRSAWIWLAKGIFFFFSF